MVQRTLTLVLRSSPGDERQLQAVDRAIDGLAAEAELTYRYVHSESQDDDTVVHLWFGEREGELIKVVDDVRLPARYLSIESRSDSRAEMAATRLRAALPVVSMPELRDEAAAADAASPGALVRLALGVADEFDPASVKVIGAALRHEAPQVRHSAATAAALLGWPQLTPGLSEATEHETDPGMRRLLDYALAKCADA